MYICSVWQCPISKKYGINIEYYGRAISMHTSYTEDVTLAQSQLMSIWHDMVFLVSKQVGVRILLICLQVLWPLTAKDITGCIFLCPGFYLPTYFDT